MEDGRLRVNYDHIASTYNHRYRSNRLSGVEAALYSFAQDYEVDRALEVGCGTGHWIGVMSSVVPHVVGLDFSIGMLREAQFHLMNSSLVHGLGEQLPFQPECFDLVFCVNALHHFRNSEAFIQASWNALTNGGYLAIVGQVPQDQPNRWYVYDHFEGTYETDIQRFHTWETVKGWMLKAGFDSLRLDPVETIQDHKYGAGVLDDPFLEKNATSQLALLTDQEYHRGIQRIQNALKVAELNGETLIFPVDLRLDMLVGKKPLLT